MGGSENENFGTLTCVESTISGNSAGNGGGIASGDGLSVIDSTLSGDTARNIGGGLIVRGPTTISGSTFSSDMAAATAAGSRTCRRR